MEVLGIVFLVLVGLAVATGLVTALIAFPDVRRYRRISRM
jgi:hypothetical protein